MKQPIIEYNSPRDALVALAKRLSVYEQHYQMDSAEFFDHYRKGQLADESSWVEWAGDSQHYVAIRQSFKTLLMNNLSIDLNDFLISNLRDKEVAREFLNASLDTYRQEGNLAEFLNSLELVSQAQQEGVTVPEIQLHQPVQFSTVVARLATLGWRLQIA